MVFGGLQKNSLIDYPGKVSCVLFVSGCNFHCPYCHNPQLVKGGMDRFNEDTVFSYLKKRKGLLDGVVISGGEPTIHKGLPALCNKIKQLGYPVKLDTNGTRPLVISRLIDEGLVDYIAMDIKADPLAYPPSITRDYDPYHILSSIRIIRESGLPYEFRTTCVKPIVSLQAIKEIAGVINGAMLYVLQRFRNTGVLDPDFFSRHDAVYDEEELLYLKSIVETRVKKCMVR